MPETLTERRDRLQQILDAGASAATVEGQMTQFDLAEVRRQLRDVQGQIDDAAGETPRRPFASRVVLGHD